MRSRYELALHRTRLRLLRWTWVVALVGVVLVPLLVSVGAGGTGDLRIELALTVGLLACSALVAALVLPSRVRSLTAAFGIERVLRSHRWLGIAVAVLVLAHVLFVLVDDPANLALLDPLQAPNRARAATVATIALLLLVGLSLARRALGTGYERWRIVHVGLGAVVVLGSALHVLWLDHLTRSPAMRDVFALMGTFLGIVLVNRWLRRPLAAYRHAYLVHDVRPESATVSTLVLRPCRPGERGLQFRPGQFAWIRLDSPFGVRDSHPFTIASGAHRPRQLEFTVRHAGDFSHDVPNLVPGQRVYLDGPHGAFTADELPRARLLLIAGGVGVTPMISMLRTLAHRRDPRRHTLVLAARTPDDLLFDRDLDELSLALDLTVHAVLSDPPPWWTGLTGRVDERLLARILGRRTDREQLHVYLCGPPGMVQGTVAALSRLGVPSDHVHTEQFEMV